MKVALPAWRVLRSCASTAPLASVEITSRTRAKVSSGTASSIRPLSDCVTTREPDHRICAATAAAISGSSTHHPVSIAISTPAATPADVTTSVHRCLPSATSAGDLSPPPRRTSTEAHTAFRTVAAPLISSPSSGASSACGLNTVA